jgi:hypothetical protein
MTCAGWVATIVNVTLTRKRQVDEMIEAYAAWHEASDLVNDAYRHWRSATGAAAAAAFGFYLTTLDHEERTAELYAGLVRRVRRLVGSRARVRLLVD